MFHIVEKRRIWFTLSLLAILPGILFMIYSFATTGNLLPLSIDYTGGTLWEVRFQERGRSGRSPADLCRSGLQRYGRV